MHFLLILFGKLLTILFMLMTGLLLLATLHRSWAQRHPWLRRRDLIIIFLVALLAFVLVGKAVNRTPSFDYFIETQGPGLGPQLPLVSAFQFLMHLEDFREVEEIAQDPTAIPPRRADRFVEYQLETEEVINEVAPGVYVNSWTFNGAIPAPFLRAKLGDRVRIRIRNKENSLHAHSVDFHAVNGPGGGAAVTVVNPGEEKTFTFKALNPGLYIYHCAGPGNPGVHMTHGQYGLILIEPEGGLPPVDKEFYIVQGEVYASGNIGDKGLRAFDATKYLSGDPTYVVFNGRTGGLNGKLTAEVGDTVRVYVGNGGVNLVSSFHLIGEIFDRVYPEGGFPVQQNIQSTVIPAGGAAIVEFTLDEPGRYVFVDHALARLDKGAWGFLDVTGEWNETVYEPQPAAIVDND